MAVPPETLDEVLEGFVVDLPFELTDAIRTAVIDTAGEMLELFDSFPAVDEPSQSRGRMADDEYNALLEVYEEPRQTTKSGRLAGLTVAVKDNIAAKDLTMTCGTKNFSVVPSYDATVVERLLDEGARLVGKTNMEPFAIGPTGDHSAFGPVVNSIEPNLISGGSSSGSGAAVAGNLVDVALGSDTGGSIRIPAACNGVVGVKPTHGLVPRFGFVDFIPSTDTIGPITRNVDTATRTLETIAGYDPRDPSSARTGPTFDNPDPGSVTAAVIDAFTEPASAVVKETFFTVVEQLEADSATTITTIEEPFKGIEPVRLYQFLSTEFVWFLRQYGVPRGQGTGYSEVERKAMTSFLEHQTVSEYIASRTLPGELVDTVTRGEGYTRVRQLIAELEYELMEVFNDVDILLMPTLRIVPPTYEELADINPLFDIGGNTVPFSLTGNPAVSLPIATEKDRPISLQLVGPAHTDDRVLAFANRIESRTPPDQ